MAPYPDRLAHAGTSGETARALPSAGRLDEAHHLVVREHPIRLLCRREHGLNKLLLRRDSTLLEPELHIGQARLVTDLDLLASTEPGGWHPGVDPIGEPLIALGLRLDDGRRMHARARTERIIAEEIFLGPDQLAIRTFISAATILRQRTLPNN